MRVEGATVLVTGANGFVGGRVCRALVDAGAQVRALVRRPGEASILQGVVGLQEIEGDFTDPDDAARVTRGVDAVVHCAAAAGPDHESARRVNTTGTRTLLGASRTAGTARFVHVSTGSVYDRGDRDVVAEDTPRVTEGDPYSQTKAEAERVVDEAVRDGLAATILRPPAVLGWAPTSTWGQRFPEMLAAGELPFTPDPRATHAWIHVDDLAAAVLAALRDEAAVGRAYNVVGGNGTWRDYIAAVATFVELPTDPFAGGSTPGWRGRYDGSRIERELGFRPARSFEQGMREAAEHWD